MRWEETSKEEIVNMEGFPARIVKVGTSYVIAIPPDIVQKLKIRHYDIVEIGIRKMDEDECRKKYNFVPPMKMKYGRLAETRCPLCGKKGRIVVCGWDDYPQVEIKHRDGGICYIGTFSKTQLLYPKLYEQVMKMKEMRVKIQENKD